MDDAMIELMTGDSQLRRRLEAYAEARLTPGLGASARMRARVLAVAHRQADLARADAALAVLPRPEARHVPSSRRTDGPRAWRRPAAAVLAASLGIAMLAGAALAARPGGPLYDTRLWVEALTLPADPSARAVAALARLEMRLEEAAAAGAAGDEAALRAALGAYSTIVDAASTDALLADDAVAEAALAAGMARNIEVLEALVAQVPDGAAAAISAALERAIERSDAAIDAMEHASDGTPSDPGGAGQPAPGAGGGEEPTPTAKPTKAPKPEPTVDEDAVETPSAKPTKAPPATAEPTRTPRPTKSPPAGKPANPGDQSAPAGG